MILEEPWIRVISLLESRWVRVDESVTHKHPAWLTSSASGNFPKTQEALKRP